MYKFSMIALINKLNDISNNEDKVIFDNIKFR